MALSNQVSDQYGLKASFSFQHDQQSVSKMDRVINSLDKLSNQIESINQTVSQSNFEKKIDSKFGKANKTFKQTSDQTEAYHKKIKKVNRDLRQYKDEISVIKKELNNVDFGKDFFDDQQFKKGNKQVTKYINKISNIKDSIEGNTTAERKFRAELTNTINKQQDRLDLLKQEQQLARKLTQQAEFEFVSAGTTRAFTSAVSQGIKATKSLADFGDRLSSAYGKVGASQEEQAKLEARAAKLGATTRFTASQVAAAFNYQAQAGQNVSEMLATVGNLLNLASAGQLGLAESADIATDITQAFNLEVSRTSEVVDTLAKVSTSTNVSVQGLGKSMSFAAAPAASLGATVQEAAAAIGVMGNVGIKGSKSGTALRSYALTLADASTISKEFGVSVENSAGKFKGLGQVTKEIAESVGFTKEELSELNVETAKSSSSLEKLNKLSGVFDKPALPGVIGLMKNVDQLQEKTLASYGSIVSEDKLRQIFQIDRSLKGDFKESESLYKDLIKSAGGYDQALEKIKQSSKVIFKQSFLDSSNLNIREFSKVKGFLEKQFGDLGSSRKEIFENLVKASGSSQKAIGQLRVALDSLGIEMENQASAAETMAKINENNLAGSFRSLNSALQSFKLEFIKPLEPLIRGVADAITQVVRLYAGLPDFLQGLISYGSLLTTVLLGLAAAASTLGVGLLTAQASMAQTAIAATTLGSGVIPLTGFMNFVTGAFETNIVLALQNIGKQPQLIFKNLVSAVTGSIKFLTPSINNLINSIKGLGFALKFALTAPFANQITLITTLVIAVEQLTPKFSVLGNTLGALVQPLSFVVGFLKGIGEALFIQKAIDSVSTSLSILNIPLETLTTTLSAFQDRLVNGFISGEQAGRELGNVIRNIVDSLISIPINYISNKIRNLQNVIQDSLLDITKPIRDKWNYTFQTIENLIYGFISIAQTFSSLITSALSENSPGPTQQIREKWSFTFGFIKDQFYSLIESAQETGEKIYQGLSSQTGNLLGLFTSLAQSLGGMSASFLGLDSGELNKVSSFIGGIVSKISSPQTLGLSVGDLFDSSSFQKISDNFDELNPSIEPSLNSKEIQTQKTFAEEQIKDIDSPELSLSIDGSLGIINDYATAFTQFKEDLLNIDNVFSSVTQYIEDFFTAFQENMGVVSFASLTLASMAQNIVSLTVPFSELSSEARALGPIFSNFGAALHYGLPLLTAYTIASGGFEKGFNGLIYVLENFGNAIRDVTDFLVYGIINLSNFFGIEPSGKFLENLTSLHQSLYSFSRLVDSVADPIIEKLESINSVIVEFNEQKFKPLFESFSGIVTDILSPQLTILGLITNQLDPLVRTIKNTYQALLDAKGFREAIGVFFRGAFQVLKAIGSLTTSILFQIVKQVINISKGLLTLTFGIQFDVPKVSIDTSTIEGQLRYVGQQTSSVYRSLSTVVVDALRSQFLAFDQWIVNQISRLPNSISSRLLSIYEALKTGIARIYQFLSPKINKIWNRLFNNFLKNIDIKEIVSTIFQLSKNIGSVFLQSGEALKALSVGSISLAKSFGKFSTNSIRGILSVFRTLENYQKQGLIKKMITPFDLLTNSLAGFLNLGQVRDITLKQQLIRIIEKTPFLSRLLEITDSIGRKVGGLTESTKQLVNVLERTPLFTMLQGIQKFPAILQSITGGIFAASTAYLVAEIYLKSFSELLRDIGRRSSQLVEELFGLPTVAENINTTFQKSANVLDFLASNYVNLYDAVSDFLGVALPILGKTILSINFILGNFGRNVERASDGLYHWKVAFLDFGSVPTWVGEFVKATNIALIGVNKLMGGIYSAIKFMGASVNAAILSIFYIPIKGLEYVISYIGVFLQVYKATIKAVVRETKGLIQATLMGNLQGYLEERTRELRSNISNFFENLYQTILSSIIRTKNAIFEFVSSIVSSVFTVITSPEIIFDSLYNMVESIGDSIKQIGVASAGVLSVLTVIPLSLKYIVSLFTPAIKTASVVGEIGAAAESTVASVSVLRIALQSLVAPMVGLFTFGLFEEFQDNWKIVDSILQSITKTLNNLNEVSSTLYKNIVMPFQESEWLSTTLSIINEVANVIQQILPVILSIASVLYVIAKGPIQSIKDLFSGIGGFFRKLINIKEAFSTIGEYTNSIIGNNTALTQKARETQYLFKEKVTGFKSDSDQATTQERVELSKAINDFQSRLNQAFQESFKQESRNLTSKQGIKSLNEDEYRKKLFGGYELTEKGKERANQNVKDLVFQESRLNQFAQQSGLDKFINKVDANFKDVGKPLMESFDQMASGFSSSKGLSDVRSDLESLLQKQE